MPNYIHTEIKGGKRTNTMFSVCEKTFNQAIEACDEVIANNNGLALLSEPAQRAKSGLQLLMGRLRKPKRRAASDPVSSEPVVAGK